jgi:hypothetical protein
MQLQIKPDKGRPSMRIWKEKEAMSKILDLILQINEKNSMTFFSRISLIAFLDASLHIWGVQKHQVTLVGKKSPKTKNLQKKIYPPTSVGVFFLSAPC